MTGQVFFADVGFRFGDDPGQLNALQEAHQAHPQQLARHAQGGTIVEFVGKAGEGLTTLIPAVPVQADKH